MAVRGCSSLAQAILLSSPSLRKPKMAFRAEEKLAASVTLEVSKVRADVEPKVAYRAEENLAAFATNEASEVKVDVEPEISYRAEDKFASPATDEASENKDDVVPEAVDGEADSAFRAEENLAAFATDEASEVKADVEPEISYRAEDKFSSPATDEASENKDDVVPEAVDGEADGEAASVHIVHLIRPEGEEPEAFDIKTLASVIGSEAAAKEAVVYHYTHAASGFSARLTPKQVADLSEKPEVLVVTPDSVVQLLR